MERTSPPEVDAGAASEDVAALLDGVPGQRRAPALATGSGTTTPEAPPTAAAEPLAPLRPLRPWRLLPTPTGTPFTFGYAIVLLLTSLFAQYADQALVYALHQGSSTDVAHLARTPVLVLVASALWTAGGITSTYSVVFPLVLTALERRIGGWRTACVFVFGHVLATLATEVPVGLAVLAGHLPDSSLHRLDYGISFGVVTALGALTGLLPPWPRYAILAGFGWMLVQDLLTFSDPLTSWGHLLSLAIGVGAWRWVRRWTRGHATAAD